MCLGKIDTEGKIKITETGWQVCLRRYGLYSAETVNPKGLPFCKPEGEVLEAKVTELGASNSNSFTGTPQKYNSGFHVYKHKADAIEHYKSLYRNLNLMQDTFLNMGFRLVIKKVLIPPGAVKTTGWQYGKEIMVTDRIYIPSLKEIYGC